MGLLLDTHIIIAIVDGPDSRSNRRVLEIIRAQSLASFASVASLWEIAIKVRLGRLPLRSQLDQLPEALDDAGVSILAIDHRHVLAELNAEPPTRDPFDRLLLAQCQVEDMRLVTVDRALVDHPLAFR